MQEKKLTRHMKWNCTRIYRILLPQIRGCKIHDIFKHEYLDRVRQVFWFFQIKIKRESQQFWCISLLLKSSVIPYLSNEDFIIFHAGTDAVISAHDLLLLLQNQTTVWPRLYYMKKLIINQFQLRVNQKRHMSSELRYRDLFFWLHYWNFELPFASFV